MRAQVKFTGLDAQIRELRVVSNRAEESVHDYVVDLALTTHRLAVEGIQQGPVSGRVYQRYQPRRVHQASAPNEYPASDTGRLAASIAFELPQSPDVPLARVGTAVRYGLFLETKPTARGGRRWLGRSLDSAVQLLDGELGEDLR